MKSELDNAQSGRTNGRTNRTPASANADGPDDHGTRNTQVLEFDLGEETYCVDIRYVAEIVDMDEFTAVPNSPRHVEGVMDLRGRTTSIIDPKVLYNIDEDGERKRIIVFDPAELDNGSATGWVVDEVDQVIRVAENDVDDSPIVDDDSIKGIVKRNGEFTLWVDPDTASS